MPSFSWNFNRLISNVRVEPVNRFWDKWALRSRTNLLIENWKAHCKPSCNWAHDVVATKYLLLYNNKNNGIDWNRKWQAADGEKGKRNEICMMIMALKLSLWNNLYWQLNAGANRLNDFRLFLCTDGALALLRNSIE